MRFVLGCTLSALFFISSFPAFAQKAGTPEDTMQKDMMKKVAFMVGTWQGEGWIMMGPGQKRNFTGTETVESKLDGTILVVEGLHRTPASGDLPERVVHHAFAVISFDRAANQYRFQSYLSDGRAASLEAASPEKNSFVWFMKDPRGGTSRYTSRLQENGEWVEVGEYSMDGKEWKQFYEMRMKKVK